MLEKPVVGNAFAYIRFTAILLAAVELGSAQYTFAALAIALVLFMSAIWWRYVHQHDLVSSSATKWHISLDWQCAQLSIPLLVFSIEPWLGFGLLMVGIGIVIVAELQGITVPLSRRIRVLLPAFIMGSVAITALALGDASWRVALPLTLVIVWAALTAAHYTRFAYVRAGEV